MPGSAAPQSPLILCVCDAMTNKDKDKDKDRQEAVPGSAAPQSPPILCVCGSAVHWGSVQSLCLSREEGDLPPGNVNFKIGSLIIGKEGEHFAQTKRGKDNGPSHVLLLYFCGYT